MPKSALFKFLAIVTAAFTLVSCAQLPKTTLLVENAVVGAMAPLESGGFVYGEWLTGEVFRVNGADTEDAAQKQSIGRVELSLGSARGLLGIATQVDRVFVSYTDKQDAFVVAELAGGQPRVIWRGPQAASVNLGGRITISPLDRVVVALGDFGSAESAKSAQSMQGKIITLDADRGEDQIPNVVSSGWTDPRGLTYDRGGNLWVADGDRAGRAGDIGFLGDVANLGSNVGASGLAVYGDQEMLVCQRANKELKRYLVVDGVRLVPGRTVAENCAYDVVEQTNGLITYATDTTIRVS